MTPLRALVIGAGHHGLVCTGSLAEAGWEATVLEQGVRLGGAVHSCERPLPGFVEDPCAGLFPAHACNAVLQAIGLERFGVEWIDTSVVMVHPLPEGRDVALHRDVDATVASLEAVRPGAGHAWADLVGPLLRHERLVRKVALSPVPPVAPALALAVRLRRSGMELAWLMADRPPRLASVSWAVMTRASWVRPWRRPR